MGNQLKKMSQTFDGVIVVGTGLSASSAAMTVYENGIPVLLLEKEKRLGGNSVKAWAGYNGSLTSIQKEKGIKDSNELFAQDTAYSAYKTYKVSPSALHKVRFTYNLTSRLIISLNRIIYYSLNYKRLADMS